MAIYLLSINKYKGLLSPCENLRLNIEVSTLQSLNDNAYIKKLKNDSDGTFLMSLNQKYAPIPVHLDRDDFRIFGKVCRATR